MRKAGQLCVFNLTQSLAQIRLPLQRQAYFAGSLINAGQVDFGDKCNFGGYVWIRFAAMNFYAVYSIFVRALRRLYLANANIMQEGYKHAEDRVP